MPQSTVKRTAPKGRLPSLRRIRENTERVSPTVELTSSPFLSISKRCVIESNLLSRIAQRFISACFFRNSNAGSASPRLFGCCQARTSQGLLVVISSKVKNELMCCWCLQWQPLEVELKKLEDKVELIKAKYKENGKIQIKLGVQNGTRTCIIIFRRILNHLFSFCRKHREPYAVDQLRVHADSSCAWGYSDQISPFVFFL